MRSLLLFFALVPLAMGSTTIGFGNDCKEDVDVFWINFEGREEHILTITVQQQRWITSYMNHKFVMRSKKEGALIEEFTVHSDYQFSVAQCGHPCHTEYLGEACIDSLNGRRNRDQLQPAWDSMNNERIRVNAAQPRYLKNYTTLGFEKVPIPPDVWKLISTFYNDNRNSIVTELWPETNPYINHWEAVPMMIWLPEVGASDFKEQAFKMLKPHLEEWAGTRLEATDFYGMRVYKSNTYLENHLDRIATHVISVIMHVDDSGDHAWPLNIYDHDGNEHNVTIAPGEMVLYESATCPHGRPSKFQGDFYVNCFAHFRPVEWIQHLRGLHREGKITQWSKGPGGLDNAWLNLGSGGGGGGGDVKDEL